MCIDFRSFLQRFTMPSLLRSSLFCLLLFSSSLLQAQEVEEALPEKYAESVASQDQILETLYAVISGEKGEARDWDHFRYLFHPDAKLIPTRSAENQVHKASYWTPEDYISKAGDYLVLQGFFEKEIYRVTDSFGPITQVFSTYESFNSESNTQPIARGINSIQLLNDGQRWWIINIYWTSESKAQPLPAKYLPKGSTE